jgi:two-component system NtrC family sensor kinase
LGVLNIYLKPGHKSNSQEIEFLHTISNTLANIIVRKRAEEEKVVMEKLLSQSQELKLLGQLTSGVAHEVRNPLNAILAISEALFQSIGDEPKYQPFLYHIRDQVERLSRLMRDLLELGRPIRENELAEVSIGSICSAAVALWKQTSQNNHSILFMDPSASKDTLKIRGDITKLQQVIVNLLDNASQHSPQDSQIQLKTVELDDGFCSVHICDQGSGVKPENMGRIFEPFFTTRKKGTGLGLNIVKHLIHIHGGSVNVWNNDPPPGCTIEIRLPTVLKKQDIAATHAPYLQF